MVLPTTRARLTEIHYFGLQKGILKIFLHEKLFRHFHVEKIAKYFVIHIYTSSERPNHRLKMS